MLENDFEPLVQVRERNECVGTYIPMDEDRATREFSVVVMERRQVVLIRAHGNFAKIAKAAYRNHAHELPNIANLFQEETLL